MTTPGELFDPDYDVPKLDNVFATCSYSAFSPSMGVPVRTSTGAPKFYKPGFDKMLYAKEVAPWGIFGKKQYEKYEAYHEAYINRLEKNKGKILRELPGLQESTEEGTPLIFLCFCGKNSWCHRRMLAEWLEERTGFDIPELGAVGNPPPSAML